MKIVKFKHLFLAAGILWAGTEAQAQYLRTSYFMEGTSSRLQMNPGLQPTRGYFNFPVIGSLNVGASSNVLGTGDIIDVLDSGEDLYTNDKLYNRLKADNRLNVNLNTDILSFGWYRGKGFWSFNVGLRADVGASIPKSMFEYLRDVNSSGFYIGNMDYEIRNQSLYINSYAEVGLGYSRKINERLTVGGRIKVLLGIANAEMKIDQFDVKTNFPENPYDTDAWNNVNHGGRAVTRASLVTTVKGGGLSFSQNSEGNTIVDGFDFDGENFGVAGKGFGIDLGASYRVWKNLTVSAAVLDLGFMSWDKGSTTVALSEEEVEINSSNFEPYLGGDFMDMEMYNMEEGEAFGRKKSLSSTILQAGEYGLLNNKVSVGALYTTRFIQPKNVSELTLSATFRPKNWLNAAVSYSPIQAAGKSIGLALKLGPLFVGTDYMFFGSNSKSVNAFLGLSFPMNKKKPQAI